MASPRAKLLTIPQDTPEPCSIQYEGPDLEWGSELPLHPARPSMRAAWSIYGADRAQPVATHGND
jgi:hypothetical protein